MGFPGIPGTQGVAHDHRKQFRMVEIQFQAVAKCLSVIFWWKLASGTAYLAWFIGIIN